MKTTPFKFIATSLLLISSSLLFTHCASSGDTIQEKITFIEKHAIDLEDSTMKFKTEGEAHGGKYFSRADSANVYGVGMIFNIPDSMLMDVV